MVRSMAGAEPTLWGSGASRRRQSAPDDLHISQVVSGRLRTWYSGGEVSDFRNHQCCASARDCVSETRPVVDGTAQKTACDHQPEPGRAPRSDASDQQHRRAQCGLLGSSGTGFFGCSCLPKAVPGVSQPGVGLESAYSGPRVELRPPVHPPPVFRANLVLVRCRRCAPWRWR